MGWHWYRGACAFVCMPHSPMALHPSPWEVSLQVTPQHLPFWHNELACPLARKEYFQTSRDFLRWCRDAWHRRWSNKSIKSHDLQVSVCRACSWKCLWKEKYVVLMGLTWNVPSVLQGRFRSDIALLRLPSFSFHPCGHRLKSTECKIRQIWKVSLVSFRKGLSCGTVCHPKQSELLV